MKLEIKDFQSTCACSIPDELGEARVAASKGRLQAVVPSAPTGSGKTITVAAVIDWTFGGADGIAARPNPTFLWLSDSPELNQQRKGRLLAACDNVPFHRPVTVEWDNIALKVEVGRKQSRLLLRCLSPAALASGWVALERSTAVHRDPANAGRRFIPLLPGDCALPDTLRRCKVGLPGQLFSSTQIRGNEFTSSSFHSCN